MANVRCRVRRYDPEVTEPPLQFIDVDQFTVDQPEVDYLGESFADNLSQACYEHNYMFRFYTMSSDPDFEFDVVIE